METPLVRLITNNNNNNNNNTNNDATIEEHPTTKEEEQQEEEQGNNDRNEVAPTTTGSAIAASTSTSTSPRSKKKNTTNTMNRNRRSLWNLRPKQRSKSSCCSPDDTATTTTSTTTTTTTTTSTDADDTKEAPNTQKLSSSQASTKDQQQATATADADAAAVDITLTPNAVKCMVNANKFSSSNSNNSSNSSNSSNNSMLVRLHNFRKPARKTANHHRFLVATISDGSQQSCIGLIFFGDSSTSSSSSSISDCIVSVKGYITSEANPPNRSPLVCLTEYDILTGCAQTTMMTSSCLPHPQQLCCSDHKIVQGGKVGSFLRKHPQTNSSSSSSSFSFLQFLAGESSLALDICKWNKDLSKVSEFLAYHSAMRTLSSSSSSSSSNTLKKDDDDDNNNNNNDDYNFAWGSCPSTSSSDSSSSSSLFKAYDKAIHEFQESQLQRQATCLTRGRHDDDEDDNDDDNDDDKEDGPTGQRHGKEAIERNLETLKMALEFDNSDDQNHQPMTTKLLCRWHASLIEHERNNDNNNINNNNKNDNKKLSSSMKQKKKKSTRSKLRTTVARTESVVFCPPKKISHELKSLWEALRTLEETLDTTAYSSNTDHALFNITFAAAALFGIHDIHPFATANGRLARIVVNWALQRRRNQQQHQRQKRQQCFLPFSIVLFTTSAQQTEYYAAIDRVRQNICLEQRGVVSDSDFHVALQCAGVLSPLVALLLDRIATTTDDLAKLVQQKSQIATEEAEEKAVRKSRECAAATGTCMICFDDQPNIATLCCGKAVHLNCIAEWLSSHNSCPQCRSDLPSLPVRNRFSTTMPVTSSSTSAAAAAAASAREAVNILMMAEDHDHGAENHSFTDDDDSRVQQLLHYISGEASDDDSSSSSSYTSASSFSSGSSSSSSSSFSSLTYQYRIHYGSSFDQTDDEDDGDDDDDDNSVQSQSRRPPNEVLPHYGESSYSYDQEEEEEEEQMETLVRHAEDMDEAEINAAAAAVEYSMSEADAIGTMRQITALQQIAAVLDDDDNYNATGEDEDDDDSHSNSDSDGLSYDYDHYWDVEDESRDVEDESSDESSDEDLYITPTASSGSFPRVSFLDPSLLSDVPSTDHQEGDDDNDDDASNSSHSHDNHETGVDQYKFQWRGRRGRR